MRMHIKTYLILVVCVIVYSCVSFNKIVSFFDDGSTITFFTDSTFSYEHREGHIPMHEFSSGIWTKTGKEITLNSYFKSKEIPVNVSCNATMERQSNQINIQINSQGHNNGIYICLPYINGKRLFTEPYDTLAYLDSLMILNNSYKMYQKYVKTMPDDKIIIEHNMYKSIIGKDTVVTVPRGSYILSMFIPLDSIRFEILRQDSCFTFETPINPVLFTEIKRFNHLSGQDIVFDINIQDSIFRYKVFSNFKIKPKNKVTPFARGYR